MARRRAISSRKSSISYNSASNSRSKWRLRAAAAAGIVISAALLWWSFRGVSLAAVGRQVAAAHPLPFLAAVVAATLTFPLRTIRWRHLLHVDGRPPDFVPLWHATAIGFMANNLLSRYGDIARGYAAHRLTRARFPTALGSIAVERIVDGVTIIALMIVGLFLGGATPSATIEGASVQRIAFSGAALFGAALLVAVVLVRRPTPVLRVARRVLDVLLPARWSARAYGALEGAVAGLEALRAPRRMAIVAFWSLVIWTTNAGSFWLAFRAFDVPVGAGAALLVQAFIALSVSVPSSPGYFGLFEAATRVGLGLYGVTAEAAVSVGIGYHVATFIPITVLGSWSLWRANLHLGDFRSSSEAPGQETGG